MDPQQYDAEIFHEGDDALHKGNEALTDGNGALHDGNEALPDGNGALHDGNEALHERNEALHLGDEASHEGNEDLENHAMANEIDNDSAIEDTLSEVSTATILPEHYRGLWENGRRYHIFNCGKYLLPNDEIEQQRLDLQNHLFELTFAGKLYLAPIKRPQRVLDVGTGTGIWAIDFADKHPEAIIIGTDLSPIQPEWIPPNLEFQIDDAEEEWSFKRNFDYIHGRMICTNFRKGPYFIREAAKNLSPGGYLEIQDVVFPFLSLDSSFENTALADWGRKLIEGAKILGKDWECTEKYESYMTQEGFVDVEQKWYSWPIGPWKEDKHLRELGLWCIANVLDWLEALSMACLTRSGLMTLADVQYLLAQVRLELRKPSELCAYIRVLVIYGKKPSI